MKIQINISCDNADQLLKHIQDLCTELEVRETCCSILHKTFTLNGLNLDNEDDYGTCKVKVKY